jgi:hypothetical protein
MRTLAILIPTLEIRKESLTRLLNILTIQINTNDVIILTNTDKGEKSTGQKRNELIQTAKIKGAEYVCFIDDDDLPSKDYIDKVMNGLKSNPDCLSLTGMYYLNLKPIKGFVHSLQYNSWGETKNIFFRCPNHLNVVKLELIESIPYENKYFGEDGTWSMAVQKSGVLKKESVIDGIIYHYFTGVKDLQKEKEIVGYD